jgi:hypothetical protein
MRIKKYLQSLSERLAYSCLRRVLVGYAGVFAAGLRQLEAEHKNFRQCAMQVGIVHADELRAINRRIDELAEGLNARLKKAGR